MATPGDRREDHAQHAASLIAAEYANAELIIAAALAYTARKMAAGAMTPQVARRYVRRTVLYAMTGLAPRVQALIAAVLATAFREALRVHGHPLPPPEPPGPGTREWEPPFTQQRETAPWERELAERLDKAGDSAGKSAEAELVRVVKAIAQAGTEPVNPYQAALGNAVGEHGGFPGSTLSARRIRAAQSMLDDLAEHGITGFTDKAGRRWDIASYAEMATRTVVSNAWDDMQAKAAARAGIDLADIGTYSQEGSCPACLPWLGRVISLTGETAGYPTLAQAKAAGFRHPSCRCFFVPRGLQSMPEVTNPVDPERAAAAYIASQKQRGLERQVRAAARAYESAVTPKARGDARRDLHAARNASEAHRVKHGVVMMKVSVRRRERPYGAR